jgi:hypothetical protein
MPELISRRLHFRRGVALLHDPHAAVRLAHDPPVPGRVGYARGEDGHRRPAPPVAIEQGLQRLAAQERRVAAHHQQRAGEALQGLLCHLDRVPGAALLGLDHPLQAGASERLLHALALVPDHHQHPAHAGVAHGP